MGGFMLLSRRRLVQGLALGAGLGLSPWARSEPTAKVVFGFGSGGPLTDFCKDFLAEFGAASQTNYGSDLVYLPGNSAARAMAAVHASPPDGRTLLLTPASTVTLVPLLRQLPNMKPDQDFVPVTMLAQFTWVFCVNESQVPASLATAKDYVKWVQQNPERGAYAIPGPGTTPHAVGQHMATVMDAPMKAQGYPGAPAATNEVVNGAVAAGFLLPGAAKAAMAKGVVRALFVTSASRWMALPGVPTLQESLGVNLSVTDNYGLFLPPGSSVDLAQKMQSTVAQTFAQPRMQAAIDRNGMAFKALSQADYAAQLQREREVWRGVVARARLSMDG
jgi:tripartite-type tricarboxylate transporter receptor subunit TctC